MSAEELRAFLEEQMIMSCATIGPGGRPHLVPLWYVPDGTELRGWTYAKSQKARNLDRDPHATVEVERDAERVAGYGIALFTRYGGGAELPQPVRDAVLRQAPKRVGLRFSPT